MPRTPRQWRLVVMAQVMVPRLCRGRSVVQSTGRSREHAGDPWHRGAARWSHPLSSSPTQRRQLSWLRHGAGPPQLRSHAVCQLVTVQVPLQLQESRQLHPRLAVHAPALASLPVQRRVTLRGRIW